MNFIKKSAAILFISLLTITSVLSTPLEVQAAAEPEFLFDVNASTESSDFNDRGLAFNGEFWFTACNNSDLGDCQLYITDGTAQEARKFPIYINDEEVFNPEPYIFTEFDNELYFIATTEDEGRELWKTDGTEEGTVLLKDINEGEDESGVWNLIEFDGELYFRAEDADNGEELWKTDGTEVGTVLLADILPGSLDSRPSDFVVASGTLYFSAIYENVSNHHYDDGQSYALFKINDARDGVDLIEDFYVPEHFVSAMFDAVMYEDQLYFTTYEDRSGDQGFYLYKVVETGGVHTPELVIQISEQECYIDDGPYVYCDDDDPDNFVVVNDALYFDAIEDVSGDIRPWLSDGTTIGTSVASWYVSGERAGEVFLDTTSEPNLLYIMTEDDDQERHIHIIDGAGAHSSFVATGSYDDEIMVEGVLFLAYEEDESGDNGMELWRVNESKDGIEEAVDVYPGGDSSYPQFLGSLGDKLIFAAETAAHGDEPRVYDISADETDLLLDITTSGRSSSEGGAGFVYLEGNTLFTANDGIHGSELWITDGTEDGTEMLIDIYEGGIGSSPDDLVAVGDYAYFEAETEAAGRELWRTDGTEVGTVMVADINSGSSGASIDSPPVGHNGSIYFRAFDGSDYHIYRVTGDGAPVAVVSGLSSIGNLRVFNNELYFTANDGGSNGWYIVYSGSYMLMHDFGGNDNGYYLSEAYSGDTSEAMYYRANTVDGDGFWRMTNDGQTFLGQLGNIDGGYVLPDGLFLYFSEDDGDKIYTISPTGNAADAEEVYEISADGNFYSHIYAGGLVYFGYYENDAGQLWVTDSTPEGTEKLGDIQTSQEYAVGQQIYFRAENEDGEELWYSDGTAEGTEMVLDINEGDVMTSDDPEPRDSSPMSFGLSSTTLYFYAYTADYGYEPWFISDVELEVSEEEPVVEEEEEEEPRSSGGSGTRTKSVRINTPTTPSENAGNGTTPGTPVSAPSFTRNLETGASGDDVKELQKFLNGNGFLVAPSGPGSLGNETDLFGQLTRDALARFQAANGISPAAGYLGPVTRALIAAMQTPAGTTPSVPLPQPAPDTNGGSAPTSVRDLEVGVTGDDVRALQELLIAAGHAISAGATGYFGTQTKDALAAYQAKAGIAPAAGYFGAMTRAQMKSAGLTGLWW